MRPAGGDSAPYRVQPHPLHADGALTLCACARHERCAGDRQQQEPRQGGTAVAVPADCRRRHASGSSCSHSGLSVHTCALVAGTLCGWMGKWCCGPVWCQAAAARSCCACVHPSNEVRCPERGPESGGHTRAWKARWDYLYLYGGIMSNFQSFCANFIGCLSPLQDTHPLVGKQVYGTSPL